ncbi:ketol-acid reductoisomerase [Chitinivibrio alkaliphilus]|uniref:Ketol-acid reductoisomerase (NADP(+)) n=1 Tax=Chitinivibrio alkaliphilus ACht1 TaxID=1313304 RepID=U7DBH2_9BACT|nr:ketol-acid reductoisomerase [Chitinivibrio alkaliphilus]ERP39367.1 Ketol-acid reductoisomerase [Chitinivibrio alkaliphilus ACht1]
MSKNYFNALPFARKVQELGQCRFMDRSEFSGVEKLRGKKIVIVGCGAQGLNQGLNLRDSGLDVSYALRQSAIDSQRQSWKNATENNFPVGTMEELIPQADLVANLTPDKFHTPVVEGLMPLMKKGATLLYSHGFNIVEEGMKVRDDITVVMVAPKSPGSEVREEYKRGFGVPTLIADHKDNDPSGEGLEIAKAYCCGTGGDRAGVLQSSFVAEVKSDLMGEQTILCGMLQTGSILCYDKMIAEGISSDEASYLVQYGWETITEALKHGGITNMMDRLSNPAKIQVFEVAEELKSLMRPLFEKHMDDILSGEFSKTMMEDWAQDDANLLRWRAETGETAFEKSSSEGVEMSEQEFFERAPLMVAMVKAGVELAFEAMTDAGIYPESAYYESLHEVPLIANTIARKKLHEMNVVISDTAEYGNYLFANACVPLLQDRFMEKVDSKLVGEGFDFDTTDVDNKTLIEVNGRIRTHPVEKIGRTLRTYMEDMKAITK